VQASPGTAYAVCCDIPKLLEVIMDASLSEDGSQFKVDLHNSWECSFLARRLGVTEQALVAAAGQTSDPTLDTLYRQLSL
jgi:hypothetical protein